MKRVNKSTNAPDQLIDYIGAHPVGTPEHDWYSFCTDTKRKKAVQTQLRSDQRGICVYCEIDLIEPSEQDINNNLTADFRVEHFHPKSDDACWHLEWTNLFACCCGGDARNVVDANNRFTDSRANRSCDVPKKDNVWDDVILAPCDIPAFPPLFLYKESEGDLEVNEDNCEFAGIEKRKVKNTIDKLHLNCKRLKDFRMSTIDGVKDQIDIYFREFGDIGHALKEVAAMLFNNQGDWPPFFTAIRSYLGQDAETYLQSINYNG